MVICLGEVEEVAFVIFSATLIPTTHSTSQFPHQCQQKRLLRVSDAEMPIPSILVLPNRSRIPKSPFLTHPLLCPQVDTNIISSYYVFCRKDLKRRPLGTNGP